MSIKNLLLQSGSVQRTTSFYTYFTTAWNTSNNTSVITSSQTSSPTSIATSTTTLYSTVYQTSIATSNVTSATTYWNTTGPGVVTSATTSHYTSWTSYYSGTPYTTSYSTSAVTSYNTSYTTSGTYYVLQSANITWSNGWYAGDNVYVEFYSNSYGYSVPHWSSYRIINATTVSAPGGIPTGFNVVNNGDPLVNDIPSGRLRRNSITGPVLGTFNSAVFSSGIPVSKSTSHTTSHTTSWTTSHTTTPTYSANTGVTTYYSTSWTTYPVWTTSALTSYTTFFNSFYSTSHNTSNVTNWVSNYNTFYNTSYSTTWSTVFNTSATTYSQTSLLTITPYAQPRRAYILLIGQSNIANYGVSTDSYSPTNLVSTLSVNGVWNAATSVVRQPSLASGTGGNLEGRIGDGLISQDKYDEVYFVNVAVGGTQIAWWRQNASTSAYTKRSDDNFIYTSNRLFERIQYAFSQASSKGFAFTHILFCIGEQDNAANTTTAVFKSEFLGLKSEIRSVGISAPIFLSRTSYYGTTDAAIIDAQNQLIAENTDIYEGPITDSYLGSTYRYDDLHFNTTGLNTLGSEWVTKIIARAG